MQVNQLAYIYMYLIKMYRFLSECSQKMFPGISRREIETYIVRFLKNALDRRSNYYRRQKE